MTPQDFLVAGMHAAVDNAHDMGLTDVEHSTYAVGCIVTDVVGGGADEYPVSGYIEEIWDDDADKPARFLCGQLLPVLLPAVLEFLSDMGSDTGSSPRGASPPWRTLPPEDDPGMPDGQQDQMDYPWNNQPKPSEY